MDKDRQNREVFAFVPSYNHAPFIEECLNSIINQTLSPKKLLVIDDGSKDDSPRIIERILKDCPFDAELIVRENRGLCATLNQGLELSDGKYFAYIGSDDFWLPEFLAARSALLDERTDCVLAFGNCKLIDDAGAAIGCTADNCETQAAYTQIAPADMLLSGTAPISPTVMYRRSALEKEGWNPEARLEDYELYLKLSSIGHFAFDPAVRSAWRVHGHNTSRDRAMMLREQLAAQSRNAGRMGLSDQRLATARAATTFRYARIALQDGDRREALRLGRTSWRGAASPTEIARFAVGLLLPEPVKRLFRAPVKNT